MSKFSKIRTNLRVSADLLALRWGTLPTTTRNLIVTATLFSLAVLGFLALATCA